MPTPNQSLVDALKVRLGEPRRVPVENYNFGLSDGSANQTFQLPFDESIDPTGLKIYVGNELWTVKNTFAGTNSTMELQIAAPTVQASQDEVTFTFTGPATPGAFTFDILDNERPDTLNLDMVAGAPTVAGTLTLDILDNGVTIIGGPATITLPDAATVSIIREIVYETIKPLLPVGFSISKPSSGRVRIERNIVGNVNPLSFADVDAGTGADIVGTFTVGATLSTVLGGPQTIEMTGGEDAIAIATAVHTAVSGVIAPGYTFTDNLDGTLTLLRTLQGDVSSISSDVVDTVSLGATGVATVDSFTAGAAATADTLDIDWTDGGPTLAGDIDVDLLDNGATIIGGPQTISLVGGEDADAIRDAVFTVIDPLVPGAYNLDNSVAGRLTLTRVALGPATGLSETFVDTGTTNVSRLSSFTPGTAATSDSVVIDVNGPATDGHYQIDLLDNAVSILAAPLTVRADSTFTDTQLASQMYAALLPSVGVAYTLTDNLDGTLTLARVATGSVNALSSSLVDNTSTLSTGVAAADAFTAGFNNSDISVDIRDSGATIVNNAKDVNVLTSDDASTISTKIVEALAPFLTTGYSISSNADLITVTFDTVGMNHPLTHVLTDPYPLGVTITSTTNTVDGEDRTDLTTAGPNDKAVQVDETTGLVTFGDDTTGKIPPKRTPLYADFYNLSQPLTDAQLDNIVIETYKQTKLYTNIFTTFDVSTSILTLPSSGDQALAEEALLLTLAEFCYYKTMFKYDEHYFYKQHGVTLDTTKSAGFLLTYMEKILAKAKKAALKRYNQKRSSGAYPILTSGSDLIVDTIRLDDDIPLSDIEFSYLHPRGRF